MKRISGDLFCFGDYFNIYVVSGRDPFIIEGGISAVYRPFKRELGEIGLNVKGITSSFILHAHPDHVMALSHLKKENPDVLICASEKAASSLMNERVRKRMVRMDVAVCENFSKEVLGEGFSGSSPPPGCDKVVEDGDTLLVGGHKLEVIGTPGHSPCSISLLLDGEFLFVSDALGGYHPPDVVDANHFHDLSLFISSLEKLSSIPCRVICLGHMGFIEGENAVRSHVKLVRDSLFSFVDDVDRTVRSKEAFDSLVERYTKLWCRDFLGFYPYSMYRDLVSLIVVRTLEYLGRGVPVG